MTPTQLRDRFRREVDDVLPDPLDDSAALWTNDEILEYLDEAQQRFVHDTRYLSTAVEVNVTAGTAFVALPDNVIELRDDALRLDAYDTTIYERAMNLLNRSTVDDYGTSAAGPSPLDNTEEGRPRHFSLDPDNNRIHFYPVPDTDSTARFYAYVEADPLDAWDDPLSITNRRHIRMLLDGMKELAYAKQDAEVYDPNQVERYRARFMYSISQVNGERQRRRRDPSPIEYGGIPH